MSDSPYPAFTFVMVPIAMAIGWCVKVWLDADGRRYEVDVVNQRILKVAQWDHEYKMKALGSPSTSAAEDAGRGESS
ncbi:hypothetical protein HRR83_008652 [Exophiala dermatitidis]|uniref:Uncharacterized protein n=2 Tax=Exophiala dermatitidis TaxID=5970 RepID=H6BWX9_EXODN|nr:uncharacterized protein HMPREF1120_04232 [Exophiala dermatitidis NIH/UT8656]KAJ4503845.1 hypothetical protein HRR75_007868 [Exophiala dermatitidis]EHY56135.1 hypothetical protein HMPREF1120_04232 [Exophiala dermatitidis NIH/UT8656]KAJ4505194.1 hypothetical protein HRR73_008467 [Exophiala dermatitidis]KAJ4505653.1 hypothetical protein HRR74_008564 [Exophiala dermatitidis]KAJ4536422.1 hypothetical protein HRR77_007341 [Exophiala dermatitidis]